MLVVRITEGKTTPFRQGKQSNALKAHLVHQNLFKTRPQLSVLQASWHPGKVLMLPVDTSFMSILSAWLLAT